MTVYVDADACPVKEEIARAAARHGLSVVLVADGGLRPPRDRHVTVKFVPSGLDAADDWIAEQAKAGDVVVTADVPLAARAVAAGAVVIDHRGRLLDADSIGMASAVRNLNTELREQGVIREGGRPYSPRDRSDFNNGIERAIRAAARIASRAG